MDLAFTYNFRIPTGDNIHQVVLAFLRTSEFGEWQENAQHPSDLFVLNFRRGRWRNKLFGGLAPVIGEPPENRPMLLTVTLRPTGESIRIGMRLELPTVSPGGGNEKFHKERMDLEVRALMQHLRDYYHLDEQLALESM